MSNHGLTSISYAVLVLVGRGGAGAHDLVRMARRGSAFHAAAPSQYYAEPKRLEQLGLLQSRKEAGRTRERTVYALTDAGLVALRAWLAEPSRAPRIGGDAIVRLLAADLVGEEPVKASLLAMRAELAEMRAGLTEGEQTASLLPHREKYLRLNFRLADRVLSAYEEWLDEVERELG